MKILMPQLGETVNEGTVSAWHKTAGDHVEKSEILLDVETDKAATEITAPGSGILTKILVDAGETVDVGTLLAVIGDENDSVAAGSESESSAPIAINVDKVTEVPTGRERGSSRRGARSGLSPAVRRLVAQHNIDLDLLSGTGRDGRIRKQDVLEFVESQAVVDTKTQDAQPATDERIPFDRIRRLTADHMVRSKATSPHVLQAIETDFSAVDVVRLARKLAWKEKHAYSLSYLPFIARAVCQAIAFFPRINSSVDDNALQLHSKINLAVAIDLNHEGLVAPVIRDAAGLSVSELAMRINELIGKARSKRLTVDDMSGGTYTLSNPGPYGTLFTAPIINQPQVAILSIDAIQKKPVVIEDAAGDAIAIRPVGVLAQSFDHRAIDGAYSAAYLAKLKQLIEQQDWSTEF